MLVNYPIIVSLQLASQSQLSMGYYWPIGGQHWPLTAWLMAGKRLGPVIIVIWVLARLTAWLAAWFTWNQSSEIWMSWRMRDRLEPKKRTERRLSVNHGNKKNYFRLHLSDEVWETLRQYWEGRSEPEKGWINLRWQTDGQMDCLSFWRSQKGWFSHKRSWYKFLIWEWFWERKREQIGQCWGQCLM